MKSPFLDTLRQRVLVYDGAMGTQLQARELSAADFGGKEGCNDYLSLTRPDVVEAVHQAYFEAGADVLIHRTAQDSREDKAQVLGPREAMKLAGRQVPLQASVTLDPSGRMLLGTDIRGALATLEAMNVEIIGLNCSTGPDLMR